MTFNPKIPKMQVLSHPSRATRHCEYASSRPSPMEWMASASGTNNFESCIFSLVDFAYAFRKGTCEDADGSVARAHTPASYRDVRHGSNAGLPNHVQGEITRSASLVYIYTDRPLRIVTCNPYLVLLERRSLTSFNYNATMALGHPLGGRVISATIVTSVFGALGTLFVALRLYTRLALIRAVGWEDLILTLSWVCRLKANL